MTRTFLASALAAALLVAAPAARAQDVKAAARATAAKLSKAVVTVKLVLKIKMGGQEQDSKSEVVGTVIDPSGLTIVEATSVDPTIALRARGGGRQGGNIEADVSEANILLDDGTEIESDVVLKDEDLDVAFIRPRDATLKLDAVTLKARGAAPEVLEDVFVMGRMGRLENRAASLATGTVRAIVKGPRTFYVLDPEISAENVGCLAFDAKGSTLGMIVLKIAEGEGGGGRGRGGRFGGGPQIAAIMRPVEDLTDLVAQAKTAKVPEKKAEEPKEDDASGGGIAGQGKPGAAQPAAGAWSDEQFKLYYAASQTGDADTVAQVEKKIGLGDDAAKKAFQTKLSPWETAHAEFVDSMSGKKEIAAAYVKKALAQ